MSGWIIHLAHGLVIGLVSLVILLLTGHLVRLDHEPQPCPVGWYVNGVRQNGMYECLPVLGDPDKDLEDAKHRIYIEDERRTWDVIHCTGGTHPVVTGQRTVGCQR